jgi:hypothetical protein
MRMGEEVVERWVESLTGLEGGGVDILGRVWKGGIGGCVVWWSMVEFEGLLCFLALFAQVCNTPSVVTIAIDLGEKNEKKLGYCTKIFLSTDWRKQTTVQ